MLSLFRKLKNWITCFNVATTDNILQTRNLVVRCTLIEVKQAINTEFYFIVS